MLDGRKLVLFSLVSEKRGDLEQMMSERHREILTALLPNLERERRRTRLQAILFADIVLSYCEPFIPIDQWDGRGEHGGRIANALYPQVWTTKFLERVLIFMHTEVPFAEAFKSAIHRSICEFGPS